MHSVLFSIRNLRVMVDLILIDEHASVFGDEVSIE